MEDGLNLKIDELKEEIIEQTQKLVRIKSIESDERPGMPFGEGINDALITALNLGERLGFKTKNIDGYMGYIEWGDNEESVGVLGHLDVVPEGDGWQYPPYGGEINDGKIFGRGTMDDKAPLISCIYAMYALKEIGYIPKKKIRILLGTNEESGSKDLEYYLKKEKEPDIGFTPDGYFPIIYAEKGIITLNISKIFNDSKGTHLIYIKGGNRPNMVPDYCEAGIKNSDMEEIMRKANAYGVRNNCDISYEVKNDILVLKCKGISAHGSTPQFGLNAIMQIISFLESIDISIGDIGEAIKFLAKYIGLDIEGKDFGIFVEDEISGKLTFNVGNIVMNENMISVGINIRYPITYKFDDIIKPFNDRLKGSGFKIEGLVHSEPLYFPKEHKLIKILSKVYEEQTGEKGELLAIGGGIYAKGMKNIVAFGPLFPGKPDMDHKANEYIEIEDLMKMTKIYANAIHELSEN